MGPGPAAGADDFPDVDGKPGPSVISRSRGALVFAAGGNLFKVARRLLSRFSFTVGDPDPITEPYRAARSHTP